MNATCTVCKQEKSLSLFTANKNKPQGVMSYCKDCNNKRNKKYRRDDQNIERACKRVYGYLVRRVKKKQLDLDFDHSYLCYLYHKQQGKCAYTNVDLKLSATHADTLSVDRIDSSKGYTKNNVCLTTWKVNNCKQDLSIEEFVSLCKMVIFHVEN